MSLLPALLHTYNSWVLSFRYSVVLLIYSVGLVAHAMEADSTLPARPEPSQPPTPEVVTPPVYEEPTIPEPVVVETATTTAATVRSVPFYSQFTDISDPAWQGVGSGIVSIAMVIDYFTSAEQDVDALLSRGLAEGAYLDHAGWTHGGLLNLAGSYNLTGESINLQALGERAALDELKEVLTHGPVLASVYYTFEEFNPIPHLVVITDAAHGYVYYNDPAEPAGGGRLTEAEFLRGWKERYIAVRPAAS